MSDSEGSPPPPYEASDTMQESYLPHHNEYVAPAVLSPEAFEAEQLKDGVSATAAEQLHDPAEEVLPEHPYFQLDIPKLHLDIDSALQDLWIALQSFQDDDVETANQREIIQQGREIGAPKPLTVTTIGPAGAGKSFLYKALFNRPNIAKSSAEGRSCTLYPTRFELQNELPDDTRSSNVDIRFFDKLSIASMAENHVRRYHDFNFGLENDPTDDDSRHHASTAYDFFKAALSTEDNPSSKVNLQDLLTAGMISNGNLLRACTDAIEKRISSLGASKSRTLSYLQVDDDSINTVRSVADHLAPFVDYLVIKTGAALLRAGLTFIDLPGLRDINQDRIARVNAARRLVDVELIICDRPERGLEDADLDALIRQSIRAHGFENTVIVYNKVDTVFMSGVQDVNDRLQHCSQEPYTTIRARMIEAGRIKDARAKRDYLTYLQGLTLNTMIREQADNLRKNVVERYSELDPDMPNKLAVFAISAAQYLEWQNPSRLRAPVMSVTDTRIPDLKRYLLGLTGKRNYDHLWNHIQIVMAEIADSGTRILEKFGDGKGYSAFYKQLSCDRIPILLTDLAQFANTRLLPALRVWPYQSDAEQQLESIKSVIDGWKYTNKGPLLVASFNKALRENGFIVNSRAQALQGLRLNWNRTLQECMEPALNAFVKRTSKRFAYGWKQMSSRIDDCMNEVFASLEKTSDQTPFKASFHREWRKLEHAVFTRNGSFEFQLHRVVRVTQRFATTEEDVGCLVASLMAPIYLKVSKETGTGKYSRQAEALDRYLVTEGWDGGTIVDRYEDAVVAELERRLKQVVHWFLDELKAEMLTFVLAMEELSEDDQQLSEGQRQAREKLRVALPMYEERLRRLRQVVPKLEE